MITFEAIRAHHKTRAILSAFVIFILFSSFVCGAVTIEDLRAKLVFAVVVLVFFIFVFIDERKFSDMIDPKYKMISISWELIAITYFFSIVFFISTPWLFAVLFFFGGTLYLFSKTHIGAVLIVGLGGTFITTVLVALITYLN